MHAEASARSRTDCKTYTQAKEFVAKQEKQGEGKQCSIGIAITRI
jgi:hypothetical protein